MVRQEDSIRALKAVHSRFYLSKTPLAVGLVGPGLIGKTLLDQLKDQVIFSSPWCSVDFFMCFCNTTAWMLHSPSSAERHLWKHTNPECVLGMLASSHSFWNGSGGNIEE